MAQSDLTQADYRPTAYADSTWEMVDNIHSGEEFFPLEVQVISATQQPFDPMFANFGGISSDRSTKRWHLPEHLAQKTQAEKEHEVVEEKRQSFTDEELALLRKQLVSEGRQAAIDEIERRKKAENEGWEKRLSGLFHDLDKQMKERLEAVERKAVDLAVAISKKLIDGVVEINPEYVLKIVTEALGLSGGATIHRVRISPQDMEFMEVVGAARHLKEYDGTWKFEADETVRAGCIVETSAGEIDYQLDAAWERVRDNILKVMR